MVITVLKSSTFATKPSPKCDQINSFVGRKRLKKMVTTKDYIEEVDDNDTNDDSHKDSHKAEVVDPPPTKRLKRNV